MTNPEESAEKAPKTDDVIMRPGGDIDRRRDEEPPPPDGERTAMRAAMDEARGEDESGEDTGSAS